MDRDQWLAQVKEEILWNAFKRLAAEFGASDKAALFHDTAARVYRLGDAARA